MKPATLNLACSCGFPRPIINSHQKKSGCDPGRRDFPEIYGFPFNICGTAEASNFKFGMQLSFAKAHQKTHPEKKWAWPWAREAPKYLRFPCNISATAALFF